MPDTENPESLSDGEKLIQLQAAIQEAVLGYQKTITELKDERDSYLRQLQRSQADLENYRKRVTKDQEIAVQDVTRGFLKKLIPVLDSIDYALGSIGPDQELVIKPLLMFKEPFLRTLSEYGVAPIEPLVGDSFDTRIHQAISVVETKDVESEVIGCVARVGYTIDNQVFRPSDVIVHKPLPKAIND